MAVTVYTSLAQQYDPVLTNSVGVVVSNAIGAVSGLLTTMLTLFVISLGVLLIMHELHWRVAVNRGLRAVAVGTLLTAAYYNQFVQQPFLTDIPAWITQVVTNGPAVSVAGQFDLLLEAVQHEGAIVKQQATGFWGAFKSAEVDLIVGTCGSVLDVVFTIYEFTRCLVALVVCVGPFVIMGLLFDYTRGYADRWVSKLVGAMILQLMYVVLVQVMIKADTQFLVSLENSSGSDVDQQIANLINIVLFFFMGAGVAVLIPGAAAYLGGASPIPPGALTRLPENIARLARALNTRRPPVPPKPAE